MRYNLERFVETQVRNYSIALNEIRNGYKCGHWMWYIFPQLKQLGKSSISRYYGIENIDEAKEYLLHPVLGTRLKELCVTLLEADSDNPYTIMGTVDGMKLCSSMTLFSEAEEGDDIFDKVLSKFYGGKKDYNTLELLRRR